MDKDRIEALSSASWKLHISPNPFINWHINCWRDFDGLTEAISPKEFEDASSELFGPAAPVQKAMLRHILSLQLK